MNEQDYIRVAHLARIVDATGILRNVMADPPLIIEEELQTVHRLLSEMATRHYRWLEEQEDDTTKDTNDE